MKPTKPGIYYYKGLGKNDVFEKLDLKMDSDGTLYTTYKERLCLVPGMHGEFKDDIIEVTTSRENDMDCEECGRRDVSHPGGLCSFCNPPF